MKDTTGVKCGLSPAATVDGSIPTEIERFTQAMYCAYSTDESQQGPWIRRFVEKGVTLSDQTCGLFFDTLERRRVDAAYAQTNMNIGGTAVTAVLSAAGHNARSAFNVATALAFGNAWFENYKGNFVLTPQLGKLHEKLKTELRKPIGDRIKERAASGDYASFDLAKVDLQEYDELCSHKAIVLLLERSVEAAQIRTFATGPSSADVEQAEVLEAELFALANPGVSGAFAKGEVEELYVVAMTASKERRLLVAAAIAKLDPKTAPYLKNLKLDADAPEARGVAFLTSIGKLRLLNDSDKVRRVRLEVDLQVEADQKAAAAGGGQPTTPAGPSAVSAQSQASPTVDEQARARRLAAIRNSSPQKEQSVRFGYEVVKPASAR
ncbi:hypothetical protein FUT87_06510 [Mitsuaria sp. TWR114]|uniref:hypothetical protein n=1 Tax=Mitsuaria sp. TWR114 TaxID=2601731 RepID=UPI0011BE314B|nr:hypothetical protein [Mitsuaria sp. TWR114]TXD95419.1 hypothetical protein FUT87_06510 [Mitsuaria sp. TWR114]